MPRRHCNVKYENSKAVFAFPNNKPKTVRTKLKRFNVAFPKTLGCGGDSDLRVIFDLFQCRLVLNSMYFKSNAGFSNLGLLHIKTVQASSKALCICSSNVLQGGPEKDMGNHADRMRWFLFLIAGLKYRRTVHKGVMGRCPGQKGGLWRSKRWG